MDYLVKWEMDIFDVSSPEEAAKKALKVQRNPESIATVFEVFEKGKLVAKIDLDYPEDSEYYNKDK